MLWKKRWKWLVSTVNLMKKEKVMAKKIRFALDMGNGIEVTDLEGLKTNFNVGKVKEYFEDL